MKRPQLTKLRDAAHTSKTMPGEDFSIGAFRADFHCTLGEAESAIAAGAWSHALVKLHMARTFIDRRPSEFHVKAARGVINTLMEDVQKKSAEAAAEEERRNSFQVRTLEDLRLAYQDVLVCEDPTDFLLALRPLQVTDTEDFLGRTILRVVELGDTECRMQVFICDDGAFAIYCAEAEDHDGCLMLYLSGTAISFTDAIAVMSCIELLTPEHEFVNLKVGIKLRYAAKYSPLCA